MLNFVKIIEFIPFRRTCLFGDNNQQILVNMVLIMVMDKVMMLMLMELLKILLFMLMVHMLVTCNIHNRYYNPSLCFSIAFLILNILRVLEIFKIVIQAMILHFSFSFGNSS